MTNHQSFQLFSILHEILVPVLVQQEIKKLVEKGVTY